MKRFLVAVTLVLAMTLAVTTTTEKAEAVVPSAVQGPPLWQGDWSAPQCTYLYICVQAQIQCVQVLYDILCTAAGRTYFAPAGWNVTTRVELYAAGFPPVQLAVHTTNCGTYRDSPYGTCTTFASALRPYPGPYVARAIAWKNQDPRPRPIATATIYVP